MEKQTDEELVGAFLASVSYSGDVRPWREVQETDTSEDEPDYAVEARSAGGPGSGDFSHAGRPGEVGGSGPQGDAPNKPLKEKLADAYKLWQSGSKHSATAKATGLTYHQVTMMVTKYNKKEKEAKAALQAQLAAKAGLQKTVEKASVLPAAKQPLGTGPGWYQTQLGNVVQVDATGKITDANGNVLNKTTPFVSGPHPSLDAAAIAALGTSTSAAQVIKDNPALAKQVGDILDTPKVPGYAWQEKTSGKLAGKFAWFQNGVQVSGAFDKASAQQAIGTIHQGAGPKTPGQLAQEAAATASAKASTGSALSEQEQELIKYNPIEKGALAPPPASAWPINDNVNRTLGSNYPKVMLAHATNLWGPKLTSEETAAISHYTGSGSTSINNYLRGKGSHSSQATIKTYSDRISSALAKAPTPPPPELVWRGMGYHGSDALANAVAPGDIIKLRGFQSASIDPEFASGWSGGSGVLFEIQPKAGAYVQHISNHKSEKEFIMPHDRQYVVHGVKHLSIGGSTRKVVQLGMLP
jgi:hypothetical protein